MSKSFEGQGTSIAKYFLPKLLHRRCNQITIRFEESLQYSTKSIEQIENKNKSNLVNNINGGEF